MQYFPLFHDLRERKVVVLGGGDAAARKLALLLRAGARPTVLAAAPEAAVRALAAAGRVGLERRPARADDLDGAALVVAAGVDEAEAGAVAEAARARGIPVNVVDRPELSSAILPALVDREPVLVAISSAGTSPVLARRLRERIEAALPERIGRLARFAGRFRAAVAAACPNPVARRRLWEQVIDGPIGRAVLAGREAEGREAMLRLVNGRAIASPAKGSVALVGAGAGDPDLLTLRALRLLQDADLVLYDATLAPALLDHARRDARRIAVAPRRAHGDEISRRMLREARRGHRVVRLLSSAASGFGRDGEAAALRRDGIDVEVVPWAAIAEVAAPRRIAS